MSTVKKTNPYQVNSNKITIYHKNLNFPDMPTGSHKFPKGTTVLEVFTFFNSQKWVLSSVLLNGEECKDSQAVLHHEDCLSVYDNRTPAHKQLDRERAIAAV